MKFLKGAIFLLHCECPSFKLTPMTAQSLRVLQPICSAGTLGSGSPEGPTTITPTIKPIAQTTPRLAPRYRVLIHNDEITPMGFVVLVLTRFFKKVDAEACEIMFEAHHKEVALVDVMGLEEAEFRVEQAHSLARTAKFPLTFTIEPE